MLEIKSAPTGLDICRILTFSENYEIIIINIEKLEINDSNSEFKFELWILR